MYIYGIDEYDKESFPSLMYDRVIAFTLLRSNVYIMVDGNKIMISEQPHELEYCNDSIRKSEKEEMRLEKGTIERWTWFHRNQIIRGMSAREIIKHHSTDSETFYIKRGQPTVYRMAYGNNHFVTNENGIQEEFSVRFYVKSNDSKKPISIIDVNLDSSQVKDVTLGSVDGDFKAFKYYCNKYFDLLKAKASFDEIAYLDDDQTINYNGQFIK